MQENKRIKLNELRKKAKAPKLVCDCEDLLPYAWSTPMEIDERKCSKILRDMAAAEKERKSTPTNPV